MATQWLDLVFRNTQFIGGLRVLQDNH